MEAADLVNWMHSAAATVTLTSTNELNWPGFLASQKIISRINGLLLIVHVYTNYEALIQARRKGVHELTCAFLCLEAWKLETKSFE